MGQIGNQDGVIIHALQIRQAVTGQMVKLLLGGRPAEFDKPGDLIQLQAEHVEEEKIHRILAGSENDDLSSSSKIPSELLVVFPSLRQVHEMKEVLLMTGRATEGVLHDVYDILRADKLCMLGSASMTTSQEVDLPVAVARRTSQQGHIPRTKFTILEREISSDLLVNGLQDRLGRHGADVEIGHLRKRWRPP